MIIIVITSSNAHQRWPHSSSTAEASTSSAGYVLLLMLYSTDEVKNAVPCIGIQLLIAVEARE